MSSSPGRIGPDKVDKTVEADDGLPTQPSSRTPQQQQQQQQTSTSPRKSGYYAVKKDYRGIEMDCIFVSWSRCQRFVEKDDENSTNGEENNTTTSHNKRTSAAVPTTRIETTPAEVTNTTTTITSSNKSQYAFFFHMSEAIKYISTNSSRNDGPMTASTIEENEKREKNDIDTQERPKCDTQHSTSSTSFSRPIPPPPAKTLAAEAAAATTTTVASRPSPRKRWRPRRHPTILGRPLKKIRIVTHITANNNFNHNYHDPKPVPNKKKKSPTKSRSATNRNTSKKKISPNSKSITSPIHQNGTSPSQYKLATLQYQENQSMDSQKQQRQHPRIVTNPDDDSSKRNNNNNSNNSQILASLLEQAYRDNSSKGWRSAQLGLVLTRRDAYRDQALKMYLSDLNALHDYNSNHNIYNHHNNFNNSINKDTDNKVHFSGASSPLSVYYLNWSWGVCNSYHRDIRRQFKKLQAAAAATAAGGEGGDKVGGDPLSSSSLSIMNLMMEWDLPHFKSHNVGYNSRKRSTSHNNNSERTKNPESQYTQDAATTPYNRAAASSTKAYTAEYSGTIAPTFDNLARILASKESGTDTEPERRRQESSLLQHTHSTQQQNPSHSQLVSDAKRVLWKPQAPTTPMSPIFSRILEQAYLSFRPRGWRRDDRKDSTLFGTANTIPGNNFLTPKAVEISVEDGFLNDKTALETFCQDHPDKVEYYEELSKRSISVGKNNAANKAFPPITRHPSGLSNPFCLEYLEWAWKLTRKSKQRTPVNTTYTYSAPVPKTTSAFLATWPSAPTTTIEVVTEDDDANQKVGEQKLDSAVYGTPKYSGSSGGKPPAVTTSPKYLDEYGPSSTEANRRDKREMPALIERLQASWWGNRDKGWRSVELGFPVPTATSSKVTAKHFDSYGPFSRKHRERLYIQDLETLKHYWSVVPSSQHVLLDPTPSMVETTAPRESTKAVVPDGVSSAPVSWKRKHQSGINAPWSLTYLNWSWGVSNSYNRDLARKERRKGQRKPANSDDTPLQE